jgi:hypothetical protein
MSVSEESVEITTSSNASGAGYNDILSSVLQLSDVRFILLQRKIEMFCVMMIIYDI